MALVGAASCGRPHNASRPSGDALAQLVVVGTPSSGPALAPEREPNDLVGQAQLLALESVGSDVLRGGVRGEIGLPADGGATDIDTYRIDVPEGGIRILRAELEGAAGVDLQLALLDATGVRLLAVDDGRPGEGEVIADYSLEPGPEYIRVLEVGRSSRAAIPGSTSAAIPMKAAVYRLNVRLADPLPAQEIEPNDDVDHAMRVPLEDERHGLLGWRGDRDVYRYALPPEGSQPLAIRADLDGIEGVDAELVLSTESGVRIAEAHGDAGSRLTLRHVGVPAGARSVIVAVRARSRGNPDVLYGLRVGAESSQGPTEIEPNDTPAQATALPGAVGTVFGNLPAGDVDYYVVPVAAPSSLTVDLRAPEGETIALDVLDTSGAVIAHQAADAPGHPIELAAVPADVGSLLLRLTPVHAPASGSELPYRLTWSLATR